VLESWVSRASDTYYNLLVQGLRDGHLSVKQQPPAGLTQLADPYDPAANAPYRWLADAPLHDLSYYREKLYLYFGITPALILFWPFVLVTGHFLLHWHAVVIFFTIGFLAAAGLLHAVWRRYFAGVGWGTVLGGTLALGLATGAPLVMARSDVYEVAIGCGHAFAMLSLAGVWAALHAPRARAGWLAAASLAYGLAIGARPVLLPGAIILLVPVALAWRERRSPGGSLLAAAGPIVLVALGVLLYNAARFGSPFEFGQRYQLGGRPQGTLEHFGLGCLWFNFRVYFLEPARWSGALPFVRDIAVPPSPASLYYVEHPFGVLANIPFVWLALAAPMAWRGLEPEPRRTLRAFLAAVALLFATSALMLLLYDSACFRYQAEFVPQLVLLAAIGTLALERRLAGDATWRRLARVAWIVLLACSLAFNVGAVFERHAEAENNAGLAMAVRGQLDDAIAHYRAALRLDPELAFVHYNLGVALNRRGQGDEAVECFESALRFDPEFVRAHRDLGNALLARGRVDDAIEHLQQVVRRQPDLAAGWDDLGNALARRGRAEAAERCYREAVGRDPGFALAHYHLGNLLADTRRPEEAIASYEAALRAEPTAQEAHLNLAFTLVELGRVEQAAPHLDEAIRLGSERAEAHFQLGSLLERVGRRDDAIGELKKALRMKPDDPETKRLLNQLGVP
jgi:tetratricopeptide (TPR) repeat protein